MRYGSDLRGDIVDFQPSILAVQKKFQFLFPTVSGTGTQVLVKENAGVQQPLSGRRSAKS